MGRVILGIAGWAEQSKSEEYAQFQLLYSWPTLFRGPYCFGHLLR